MHTGENGIEEEECTGNMRMECYGWQELHEIDHKTASELDGWKGKTAHVYRGRAAVSVFSCRTKNVLYCTRNMYKTNDDSVVWIHTKSPRYVPHIYVYTI